MFCTVGHKGISMWLSLHIFYSGSFDQLIVYLSSHILLPLQQQGLVKAFFYVRYHERGPHIRLRLLPVTGAEDRVAKKATITMRQYLEAHPASRAALEQQYDASITAQWYPEGSVQTIAYIPETERYGGEANLAFCELHFMCSSLVVAQLIKATPAITSGKQLLYATILAVQFGKNCVKQDIALFYNSYYQEWRVTALKITGLQQEAALLKQFETAYAAQLATLNVLFEQADDIGFGDDAIDGALDNWNKGNEALALQLQASGLQHPRLMSVLRSLLHMTFNRLGIRNEEECYITWMMARYFANNGQVGQ
jgi:thiopeptide-type bacteriocin biosynthesis protein